LAEVRPDPAPCEDRPRGFGAPIAHLGQWEELSLDPARRVLRIDRWTESMGGLETQIAEWSTDLPVDSVLLMDVQNSMAPTRAQESFEGRIGGLHPRPAQADRELALGVGRLAWALSDHGFVLEDLVQVPTWEPVAQRAPIEALLKSGLCPTRRLYAMPGERLWLRARRAQVRAGSVLLARRPGQEALIERSRRAIEAWLPASWEVCLGDIDTSEIESWNSAVTHSCGEVLFFLRAGDEPCHALFEEMWAQVPYHPVRAMQGKGSLGCAGIMAERAMVLDVGPLPREIPSGLVAGEEWVLRAQSCSAPLNEIAIGEIPGDHSRFAQAPTHPTDAADAARLQQRWAVLHELDDPGHPKARQAAKPSWVEQDREPRISLCMIARNEEKDLPRCLEQIRDHVDEIILVDTGSTDRTVEIAESHGARVLHRAWDDDFSAPRNLALEQATGDWILVLDADEVVTDASLPMIRDLCSVGCACGYHMCFYNEHETERSHGITMVRLFRNLPGIRYQNAIHEQVIPSLMERALEQNLVLLDCRIEVLHYGYSEEQIASKGKIQRNMVLFEKQLEAEPEDVYTLYKYGDFLRQIDAPARDIIAVFQRTLDLMLRQPPSKTGEMPYAGEVCALLALELAKDNQATEGDRVVRIGLTRFMPTPNLHYIAATLALDMGRCEEALAQYRHCLAFRGRNLVVPVQEGSDSWIAFAGMGECWFKKNEFDRAEDLFRRAVALAPHWEVGVMRLASYLASVDRHGEALELVGGYLADYGDEIDAPVHAALMQMKNFLERTGHPARVDSRGDLLSSPIEGPRDAPSVPLGESPDPLLARK